jgi:hypothetical protein
LPAFWAAAAAAPSRSNNALPSAAVIPAPIRCRDAMVRTLPPKTHFGWTVSQLVGLAYPRPVAAWDSVLLIGQIAAAGTIGATEWRRNSA